MLGSLGNSFAHYMRIRLIALIFRKHCLLLRDERGATAMVVACMFTLLLALLAALTDTARLTIAQNRLQSALDSAALAAVRDANTLDVQQEVTKFFNANFPSGYMGMAPSTISVTQNGNEYSFSVSSPLPRSILTGSGTGDTIVVTAKVRSGSSSGPPAELALILDTSGAMSSVIGGSSTTRIDLMKSAVGNLMDRIQNGNNRISMIPFSDSIRIDPARGSSWLQTTPAVTRPDFSGQTSSDHGRWDGCISTKFNEDNSTYPTSNTNNYLTNNEAAPSTAKFRHYIGPVDRNAYTQSSTFYNYFHEFQYAYNQSNGTKNAGKYVYSYGYNYLTGASVSGNSSPPVFIPKFYYGTIHLDDDLKTVYSEKVTSYTRSASGSGASGPTSSAADTGDSVTIEGSLSSGSSVSSGGSLTPHYVYSMSGTASTETSPGFNFKNAEVNNSFTTPGSAQNYNYFLLEPQDLAYPYFGSGRYKYTNSSYTTVGTFDYTSVYKRSVNLSHRYSYVLKFYFGYAAKPGSTMPWKAYDENGVLLAQGNAVLSSGGGTGASRASMVGTVYLPVPFRPFASVSITYPEPDKMAGCSANTSYFCYELHKNGPNRYCYNGTCYSMNSSFQEYEYIDYVIGYNLPGPIVGYPNCSTLTQSRFFGSNASTVKNTVNNLIATGPARVNVGLNWGWRALSPNWRGLFSNGSGVTNYPLDYSTSNNKSAVLMTQGDSFKNKARTQNNPDGSYFDDVSFSALCNSIKARGIKLYVIGVGVTNPATITRLRSCATSINDFANITNSSDYATIIGRIADGVSTGHSGSLSFR